ncbi:hypothetical protein MHYP_G00359320 [Metynnis hypsauchen]
MTGRRGFSRYRNVTVHESEPVQRGRAIIPLRVGTRPRPARPQRRSSAAPRCLFPDHVRSGPVRCPRWQTEPQNRTEGLCPNQRELRRRAQASDSSLKEE